MLIGRIKKIDMRNKKIVYLTHAALIAAIYVILTIAFRPFGFGMIQFRISEALAILPYFTSAAIPGISIGCLLGNLFSGADILDIIFGTLASLIGALGSYMLRRKKYLVPLPPIISNTLIIPWVLRFAYGEAQPIYLMMITIGLGEIVGCGILGILLLVILNRYKNILFPQK